MVSQIWLVIRKEFQLLARDKKTLAIYLLGPILIMMAVGSATGRSGSVNVNIALDPRDKSSFGENLAAKFRDSSFLTIEKELDTDRALDELKLENIEAVIVIPEDFGKNIRAGQKATILIYVDNTSPGAAQKVQLAATQAISEFQMDLAKKQGSRSGLVIEIESKDFYEGEFEGINRYAPNILPLVIVWIPMMMTGMAIVSERVRGTLARSLMTPLSRLNMIVGKMVTYVVVAIVQIIIIMLVASVGYGMKVHGGTLDVFLILLLTSLTGLSLGMFISVIGTTDRQVTESIPVVVLLLVILGGVLIPIQNMPKAMQSVAKLTPLYKSSKAIRGALQKGLAISSFTGELMYLLALALGILGFAVALFYFEDKMRRFWKS